VLHCRIFMTDDSVRIQEKRIVKYFTVVPREKIKPFHMPAAERNWIPSEYHSVGLVRCQHDLFLSNKDLNFPPFICIRCDDQREWDVNWIKLALVKWNLFINNRTVNSSVLVIGGSLFMYARFGGGTYTKIGTIQLR
jgi:hypothetical protein